MVDDICFTSWYVYLEVNLGTLGDSIFTSHVKISVLVLRRCSTRKF